MERIKHSMLNVLVISVSITFIAVVSIGGCSNGPETNQEESNVTGMDQDESNNDEMGSGEHGAEGENDGEGEESGTSLGLDEIYDTVRNGARLILRYDSASNSFVGTVENTTDNILQRVRVEVHLSNGTELGPTTPVDLAPGEVIDVTLSAAGEEFTGWTPHAEVDTGDGGGEHGEGGEGGGEGEGGEGGGEHGEGGDGGGGGGEHGTGG